MQRVLTIVFFAFLFSCENNDHELKTVDLERFTLQIPRDWNAAESQGYDSFVGEIRISAEESVSFDLGWYSDKLNVDPASHDFDLTTIDGKAARIVRPKNFGHGTTGVYFDSLETSKTNKFQMSASGLNPKNQKALLAAIRSLKFN